MREDTRYLAVSRVGAHSLHSSWVPSDGSFDVLLSYYEPAPVPEPSPHIMIESRAGTKVAGYGALIREHLELLRKYRYIALLDDDIATDAMSILRLFQIADTHRLKICQPALDYQSYFTHACLFQHKGFVLRHVNFVEMMCPFFRTDVLEAIAPLFELGLESGIDLVWSALANETPQDFAVIDCVPVRHTRPVGGTKSVNGFVNGRNYDTDIRAALEAFDLAHSPVLPHGGLRPSGKYASNRLSLFIEASRLIAAIPIRSLTFRMQAVGRYWLQLLLLRALDARTRRPEPVVAPPIRQFFEAES